MIAIHREGSEFDDRWSDRWIAMCSQNNIPHRIVDCYSSSIIDQLEGCTGLMWHWNQQDYRGALFARQLFHSLSTSGLLTFPDLGSVWHHDDKVGQKYLLEAVGAPLVKSYVFYDLESARDWCETTNYPVVFKLRGGAGSVNVRLVRSKREAIRLISKSFGAGFNPIDKWSRVKDRLWRLKRDRNIAAFKSLLGGFGRLVVPNKVDLGYQKERGYAYFQEFVPGNKFDTRLIVVGDRCFGVRRFNREGDFRASGSGVKDYNHESIDIEAVRIAFETAGKLQSTSMAFDFLQSPTGPKIVEISYCYVMGKFYDDCVGYWDSDLNWHDVSVDPQRFILEDFLVANGMAPMGFVAQTIPRTS